MALNDGFQIRLVCQAINGAGLVGEAESRAVLVLIEFDGDEGAVEVDQGARSPGRGLLRVIGLVDELLLEPTCIGLGESSGFSEGAPSGQGDACGAVGQEPENVAAGAAVPHKAERD